MTRLLLAGIAFGLVAAPSHAGDLDARCRAYDRPIAETIKAMLDRDDARSTTHVYTAISQLTSARIECGQARIDTALIMYRRLQRMLDQQRSDIFGAR